MMPTTQSVIPQVPSRTPLGHLRTYVGDPLAFLQAQTETYGDTFRFRLVRRQLIATRDPELVQGVLQSKHRSVIKNKAYRKLGALLGDGLFTSDGDTWRSHRRMMQPSFHRDQILSYHRTFRHYAQDLVEEWRHHEVRGTAVDATESLTRVTLKIIAKTMLGLDLDREGDTVAKHLPPALQVLLTKITSPLATPLWLPTASNRIFNRSVSALDALVLGLIETRRAAPDKGGDLLGELLQVQDEETGQGLSDQEIRNEMLTFFLAGHETTAIALTWTLHLLLLHPLHLAQLQKELATLPESYTPEDLAAIPILKPIIQEALRLLPPIWVLGRQTLEPLAIGNYDLPTGASIIFSPYLIHRHPGYWSQPEAFRPERFMSPESGTPHKYAYLPFGGGPRLCIGHHFAMLEMQVILAELLRSFSLSMPQPALPGFEYSLTLRPSHSLYLQLSKS